MQQGKGLGRHGAHARGSARCGQQGARHFPAVGTVPRVPGTFRTGTFDAGARHFLLKYQVPGTFHAGAGHLRQATCLAIHRHDVFQTGPMEGQVRR